MAQRILIVEDEPLVAMELRETLLGAGYDVPAPVDSADGVLTAVRELKPDLVVMDIRLRSFVDGIDAVSRLRFMGSLPVIYLTAYSTPDVRRRAENTQPEAFLVKPVDGAVLIDTVASILSRPPAPV